MQIEEAPLGVLLGIRQLEEKEQRLPLPDALSRVAGEARGLEDEVVLPGPT